MVAAPVAAGAVRSALSLVTRRPADPIGSGRRHCHSFKLPRRQASVSLGLDLAFALDVGAELVLPVERRGHALDVDLSGDGFGS